MDRRTFLRASAAAAAAAFFPRLRAAEGWPDDPFLSGPFAPVFDELDVPELPVEGALPEGLSGIYLRNGPNPQFPPLGGRYHWFDGDGMIHAVALGGGRAAYHNRWVLTEGLLRERAAGEALWPGLAGLQRQRKVPRSEGLFKDAANTNLLWHHGELLALWEGGAPWRVSLPELSTVGEEDFGGALDHGFTAHPKIDPRTGDLVAFGYDLMKAPYVHYSVFDPSGARVHATTLDLPHGVMMHDFAITERYTLFLDLPVRLNIRRALTGRPPMEFRPGDGARIGVLARRAPGSEIRWFEVDPCYVFHTLAAWEDGDAIELRACRFQEFPDFNAAIISQDIPAERHPQRPYLYRWRLDLTTGAVSEGWLSDRPADFPRIHEGRQGARVRYGYAAAGAGDGWVKFDLDAGTEVRVDHGGMLAGEPVFVPRPGGTDEDDGWILGFATDRAGERSQLLVVDARDVAAGPVARVQMPRRVPLGFHGTFVGAGDLGRVAG